MTDLSPAAAAVLKEFEDSWDADPYEMDVRALGAALRAAADHIHHDWTAFNCIDSLCEIAAELESLCE